MLRASWTESEPGATTLLLFACGVLLLVAVLSSRASRRTGLPVGLLFLAVGMAAGAPGLGGVVFHDYRVALRLGTLALTLILFDGGLNTSLSNMRRALWPASALATVGVVVTATLGALAARLLRFSWPEALLLGAVASSTDAAAVFSALRSSGLQLQKRVALTLEFEAGFNDPLAVLLTMAVIKMLSNGGHIGWSVLVGVPLQLGIGVLGGVAVGGLGRWILARVSFNAAGLYPVLTTAIALLAYAVPSLLNGSGFLAVYLAGVIVGNGPLPYRVGLQHVHDAFAWFGQVVMFLLLGLLVTPSMLVSVASASLALGLLLAFVARPVAVTLCLLPFRFSAREIVYVAWVGLRGAVPIVLATIPVLAHTPGAQRLFHVVFFVVVLSTIVPGATVRWATRALALESKGPPPPPAMIQITSTTVLQGVVMSFFIDRASAVCDARISEIPFPEGTSALLVIRDRQLIAARGSTVLEVGDHVYVFCRPDDRPLIYLLFGAEEQE